MAVDIDAILSILFASTVTSIDVDANLAHIREYLDLFLQWFHKVLNCLCKADFITWDNFY